MSKTLTEVRDDITAALELLPMAMRMNRARVDVLLHTTRLQEAPNGEQCQLPAKPGKCGPARGTWQFERGGGVAGVLRHEKTRDAAMTACRRLGVEPTVDGVYDALPGQVDTIDAVFARLLYWADPLALPKLGDEEGAFLCYLRNWRPGAWTRGTAKQKAALRAKWKTNYAQALAFVQAAA